MSKKHLQLFLYTALGLICFSATEIPSINDMMSIEDQRKTGVIRLKQAQKMELARWLVEHGFYEHHAKVDPKYPPLLIQRNIGTLITLTDGSEWEIAPEDISTAKTWKIMDKIEVVKTENPMYPFKLINKNTKGEEFVKARFPFTL